MFIGVDHFAPADRHYRDKVDGRRTLCSTLHSWQPLMGKGTSDFPDFCAALGEPNPDYDAPSL
jgi:hypothetical protein